MFETDYAMRDEQPAHSTRPRLAQGMRGTHFDALVRTKVALGVARVSNGLP